MWKPTETINLTTSPQVGYETVVKVMDDDVEGGAGEGSDLKLCLFS